MKKHQAEDTNICSSLFHRSYTNNCPAFMSSSSNDYSSDFAYISKQNPAFVDKTYVIKDVIETRRMILTAPPHFGKSVNISMLKYFFEIEVNKETAEPITQFDIHSEPVTDTYNYKLFDNLAVHRLHPEIMENCFGRHPVIQMDFSLKTSIKSYQEAVSHCQNVVRKAFKQHSYLLQSTKWRFNEDSIIRRYCDNVEFQKLQQSNTWIWDISDLIRYLYEHFGRKCIFLVDEYDAVFRASLASTDGDTFQKCRGLYASLIDSPIHDSYDSKKIAAVVLSGISPMAIYGTRDLDRLQMCEFLQHNGYQRKKLFDFHGFTRQEFDFLMDKHHIPVDMRQQATEYYGGYCSMKNRDEKYYNPYSVAHFLQTKVIQEYWSNSEFFEKYQFLLDIESVDLIIKQLIFERTFKATLERQKMDGYLIETLHDKTSCNSYHTAYLIACLYEQGYLQTVEYYKTDFGRNRDLLVKVANKEVKLILIEELKKYYRSCGKFDWNSMKACAELFDDIDFGYRNPDLRKIYSLLEKYYNGFFAMNEKSIDVRSYESEVIEGHLRRLLYNIASLTKHRTTIIDPDKYSRYEKTPIDEITPDVKMCSNEGCIMIQAKYDATAEEVLNQIILHSSQGETIKYILIGLNLSKDKRLSMKAKIGDDIFTYGSEDSS